MCRVSQSRRHYANALSNNRLLAISWYRDPPTHSEMNGCNVVGGDSSLIR